VADQLPITVHRIETLEADVTYRDHLSTSISRRTFLKGAGGLGAAAAVLADAPALAGTSRPPATRAESLSGGRAKIPIDHIIVDCQENRSFDHYYGFAPLVLTNANSYAVPPGYEQPNGTGGFVAPYHFKSLSSPSINNPWAAMHQEYDGGKMDGFYTTNGINCMGYYTAEDLPFYYSLFTHSTLCVNYFSSVMGPTYPNRFYLVSGTSGGITTNGVYGYGVFKYPIILDLLEAAGITWKIYNTAWDSVPAGDSDNVFVFWKRWANDVRTKATTADYLSDVKNGKLPQVSFVIPSYLKGHDEHPPANIQVGMKIQQRLVTALQSSSAWGSSVYIITYDEAGGYFDHISPPQLDAYGLGFRVPTWVISPYAKQGHLETTLYEHSSILKFIERVFGLPTLASVNHSFDISTPGGSNYEAANGKATGPAAPPRDGLRGIGNLMECFI
jgi:phospholipase C